MRYLIVSDIHGSLPALQQVLHFYHAHYCDMLCLLGDILNYGPRNSLPEGLNPKAIADSLNAMSERIIAVRGNCESEVDQMLLQFPVMTDYAIIVDNGRKLFLTHGHRYNDQQLPWAQCDALFFGHTHLWKLECKEGLAVCNTGSPTFPKGGNQPTFAEYADGVITVYNLKGEVLRQLSLYCL